MALLIRILVIVAVVAAAVGAVEPNYVRTTVYAVDAVTGETVHPPQVTTVYSDGLGRTIQTQVALVGYSLASNANTAADALVSMTRYDDVGRPYQSYQSAPMATSQNYVSFSAFDAEARAYRSSSGSYPFSETAYWDDPLGRVKATSAPGDEFAIDAGHDVRTWTVGVCVGATGKDHYDENGFAKLVDANGGTSGTSVTDVNNFVDNPRGPNPSDNFENPTHVLTITRDQNGNYTQQLHDSFGRLVKTSALHGDANAGPIIASYRYDILGNLLEEEPPKEGSTVLIDNTSYTYNTLGQLISKYTPDAGTVEYSYDQAGRLVWYVDAQMAHIATAGLLPPFGGYPVGEVSGWTDYDPLGRDTAVYVRLQNTVGMHRYYLKRRSIYDDGTKAQQYLAGTDIFDLA